MARSAANLACSSARSASTATPTCISSRPCARTAAPSSASSRTSAARRPSPPPAPSSAWPARSPVMPSGPWFSRRSRPATPRGLPARASARLCCSGPLLFGRLWEETGCRAVIEDLLAERRFEFPVERAIFATVLHRIMVSGSDRACEKWMAEYDIPGVDGLTLHHLYRAMAWLGEELPADQQGGATPFAPRAIKDLVEEQLFARRRDLFSELSVVFLDTTSLSFTGAGGESLGERGYSKDHRPDLLQMIVGVVIDAAGRPVCSEMWPGNTA